MAAKMYVNLQNIKYNLEKIKERINNTVTIIAMVKADAYGLGDTEVSKFLKTLSISFLGVAIVDEGVHLRKNLIDSDILVAGQFLEEDIQNILDYNLTVSVSNMNLLKLLNEQALIENKKVKIHIKVDTGMTRLGFNINEIQDNLKHIKDNLTNISIDGIYTHLSSADTDDKYTLHQLNNFDDCIKLLTTKGFTFNYIHALNSSGLLKHPKFSYNAVRIGDLLYGYYPDESLRSSISLKPAVKITAPIINLREINSGCSVSYSRTFKSSTTMKIATIQIGYADGLDRKLSNKLNVYINNIPCRIIGNICMDMCMIDVTNVPTIQVGDYCTILDYDDSIYTIANIIGTINYEIISRISKRVKRIYIQ
ncbi:MAG: alanine racemase [Clostridia bacterium]|nr:alanine racemase [Clostridia bacterium]MDD4386193.1 alanine racemase [Clostridia bacterium]